VEIPLALREELSDHKARSKRTGRSDPVFVNSKGRRENTSNLGRRVKTVVRRAQARFDALGIDRASSAVNPYSFRRLYSSLRYALGDDPVFVAAQMGHNDGGELSMSVYASAVRRRERLTGATLKEFDRALEWAAMGAIESANGPRMGREPITSPSEALPVDSARVEESHGQAIIGDQPR
jgi:hypothetical protein